MITPKTDTDRMYEVADDYEAATLDALRNKAGLTWECRDKGGRSHWTNGENETKCGECGKRRFSAAAILT